MANHSRCAKARSANRPPKSVRLRQQAEAEEAAQRRRRLLQMLLPRRLPHGQKQRGRLQSGLELGQIQRGGAASRRWIGVPGLPGSRTPHPGGTGQTGRLARGLGGHTSRWTGMLRLRPEWRTRQTRHGRLGRQKLVGSRETFLALLASVAGWSLVDTGADGLECSA